MAPCLSAMQLLDAADYAELVAEISTTVVNHIALMDDRIAKVVRAPDGFAVEHDAGSGELYLWPAARQAGTHLRLGTLIVGPANPANQSSFNP